MQNADSPVLSSLQIFIDGAEHAARSIQLVDAGQDIDCSYLEEGAGIVGKYERPVRSYLVLDAEQQPEAGYHSIELVFSTGARLRASAEAKIVDGQTRIYYGEVQKIDS